MCHINMALLATSGRHIYHSLWRWISLQSKDKASSYLKYIGIYSIKVKWKAFAVFVKILFQLSFPYLKMLKRSIGNLVDSTFLSSSMNWYLYLLFLLLSLLLFYFFVGFSRDAAAKYFSQLSGLWVSKPGASKCVNFACYAGITQATPAF